MIEDAKARLLTPHLPGQQHEDLVPIIWGPSLLNSGSN